jgi:hypothetical protein
MNMHKKTKTIAFAIAALAALTLVGCIEDESYSAEEGADYSTSEESSLEAGDVIETHLSNYVVY